MIGWPYGRHRQLDAPAGGERAVTRHDLGHERADQREQIAPLAGRELAAARGEPRHQRVAAPHGLPEPRQVIPDRQIVDELIRGVGDALGRTERLGDRRQLEVRTEALDHVLAVPAQAGAQQRQALGRRARHRVRPEEREHRIGQRRTGLQMLGDAPCDLLELLDEQRGEVDHRARGRVRLQVRRHVGVILDGVQVGPRQRVLAGERIAVLRLVHVPQEDRPAGGPRSSAAQALVRHGAALLTQAPGAAACRRSPARRPCR